MPSKKVPVKPEVDTTPVVPVPVPVPTSVPVSEPVVKKVKKVKSEPSVETQPSVTPTVPEVSPVIPEVVPVTDVPEVTEVQVTEKSVEFLAKLQQLGVLLTSLKVEYKTLERQWARELKLAQKQSSKRKRKAGNRAPSGFVKPTRISAELATFLNKPLDAEMARTEVTSAINGYVKQHKLQDKENGRKINPDAALTSLLKLKKEDELTYFNLQKYMSPHFIKPVPKVQPVA
ncbi:MAG: hypothetical protein EBV07_01765 [Proteobacteria bacterium]|nr:hypothetical protein [Pseudomonadota bacterium]